ncbi:MAG TPA: excinuclease ABC subunit B [Clostridiales bacterium]|jgi:protein arginine kinase activator|nr:excinuclease ABC subunit B [Clostridiales bacterium]
MLCDRCKIKEAKVLYTEIINGAKTEQHLCEECATDYTSFQMEKPLLNSELTLNSLLSTLLGAHHSNTPNKPGTSKSGLVCDNCRTTFDEFLQRGRFGCSQCYKSFYGELANTLRSIHGAQAHTGKRPKGYISTNDKIIKNLSEEERLTLELQEAIEKEEFEEAARLRDLIRSLKKEETKNA